jgi:O-antigen biosynthesis protein
VIVCTRERPAPLRRCLASLRALDGPAPELIVVDNSAGAAQSHAAARQAGATYVVEPRRGLSAARNRGIAIAGGELIAFIDDDAVAEAGWLKAHGNALASSEAIATTGRILPIGTTATGSTISQMLDLGDQPFSVDASRPSWFELANFGGLGFGGNMVVRRSAFEDGFRFSERLGRGTLLEAGEESYLFFSLIRAGHSVAYVPEAVVRHEGPPQPDQRAYELAGTRRYGAYLAMLLVEEPDFRRRTFRYALEALRRPPRPWRRVDTAARTISRPRALAAGAEGPWLYLRSRCTRAGERRLASDG